MLFHCEQCFHYDHYPAQPNLVVNVYTANFSKDHMIHYYYTAVSSKQQGDGEILKI